MKEGVCEYVRECVSKWVSGVELAHAPAHPLPGDAAGEGGRELGSE